MIDPSVSGMGLVEAARAWADAGFHPIALHGIDSEGRCTCGKPERHPGGRGAGKHPVDSGWQSAPLDLEELCDRLHYSATDLNIGLRMGSQPDGSRLLAVDDDGGLGEFEARHGALPPTLTLASGGGGRHRIFRVPDGTAFKNTVRVGGLALDLRCDGGQIVVAPSMHASGSRYSVADARPVADMPAKFVELLRDKPAPAPAAPRLPASWELGGELRNQSERVLAYCRKKAAEDPSIQGSNGSSALARWAGAIFWKMGLSETDGLPLLREMNAIGASPPWSETELLHAMRNGQRPHESRPGARGSLLEQWRREGEGRRHTRASTSAAEEPEKVTTKRPRICLNNHPDDPHREWHALVDDAAAALGTSPEVFCRNGRLVDAGPVDIYVSKRHGERERASVRTVGVRELPVTEVQRVLSRAAHWSRWVKPKGKDPVEVPADPPMGLAVSVGNMWRWKTVRPLAGVLTAPSIRPDGSIIQAPGWDEATRFLYEPARDYPEIPERPTQDDAREALAVLREVFAVPGDGFDGFPFTTDAERDVPIANVLTLIARPAIDGCVPAFVYDASTPGSGKGLIADTVCAIATGQDMPKGVFTDNQEELSKYFGSLILAGAAVAGFDNIDQRATLSGAVLDAVLTARRPQIRILGRSEAPVVDWHAVVMVTGNNVQITGDTERRCIKCRQEPSVERPELRANFRVPNLLAHVQEHRPRLVQAALTILRAYFVAGRPDVGVCPLGSFEAWTRVVVNALVFAGGHDVTGCAANKAGVREDPELAAATALLAAMHRLGEPMSASELVSAAYDWETDWQGVPRPGTESSPELKEALDELVTSKGKNGRPSPKSVGWALKRIQGRVFDGLRLRSRQGSKGAGHVAWAVEEVG